LTATAWSSGRGIDPLHVAPTPDAHQRLEPLELYVGGHKDGRPWKLGSTIPRGPDGRSFATIELSDSTFSTIGDYARSS